MKSTIYLVIFQPLRNLPSIHLLPWSTLLSNVPPTNLTLSHKPAAVTSVFILATLHQELSIIKLLSTKSIQKRKVPSNLSHSTLPPLKYWNQDLAQQTILFRGTRIVKRLVLVTPITIYNQEFFCSNVTKVDSLVHHVTLWDFKDTLMNRKFCYNNNVEWNRVHPIIDY